MFKINPEYIIKNYILQDAIDAAKEGDYTLTNDLLNIAQILLMSMKSMNLILL